MNRDTQEVVVRLISLGYKIENKIHRDIITENFVDRPMNIVEMNKSKIKLRSMLIDKAIAKICSKITKDQVIKNISATIVENPSSYDTIYINFSI